LAETHPCVPWAVPCNKRKYTSSLLWMDVLQASTVLSSNPSPIFMKSSEIGTNTRFVYYCIPDREKYVGWLFHLSEMIADIIVGWIRSHGVGGYIIPTQIRSRVLFSKRKNSSSTLTFVSTCVGAYPRPPDNVIRERARMQICMASWIDFFSLLAQHTDLCTCFQSHFWHTLSQ